MISRLKLSKEVSQKLLYLSNKLKLRRNIVCRLAVGKSLTEKETVKNLEFEDSAGFEFNRYTLTGNYDGLTKALIIQHGKKKISDSEYFSKYLRSHIERGINLLYLEYNKVNSPIEFLVQLASSN